MGNGIRVSILTAVYRRNADVLRSICVMTVGIHVEVVFHFQRTVLIIWIFVRKIKYELITKSPTG